VKLPQNWRTQRLNHKIGSKRMPLREQGEGANQTARDILNEAYNLNNPIVALRCGQTDPE
jgi:hypothetical protein